MFDWSACSPLCALHSLCLWPSISFLKKINLFIWLCQILVAACRVFSCRMWAVVPRPGIEPRPPALGAQNLSHWITKEVPGPLFLSLTFEHGVSWQSLCCFGDCLTFINNSRGHDDDDQHPNIQEAMRINITDCWGVSSRQHDWKRDLTPEWRSSQKAEDKLETQDPSHFLRAIDSSDPPDKKEASLTSDLNCYFHL